MAPSTSSSDETSSSHHQDEKKKKQQDDDTDDTDNHACNPYIPKNDIELIKGCKAYQVLLPNGIGTSNIEKIQETRKLFDDLNKLTPNKSPYYDKVDKTDHKNISGLNKDDPNIMVRIYRPKKIQEQEKQKEEEENNFDLLLPALLYIHPAGHMFSYDISTFDGLCEELVVNVGCIVVSVQYRLSPECSYPGPIEDCYAALLWLHDKSKQLGIDSNRIGLFGMSSGGGIAACLSLMVRDNYKNMCTKDINICYQMLIYPMLDNLNVIRDDENDNNGDDNDNNNKHCIWTKENNTDSWKYYLGGNNTYENCSCYASIMRAKSLNGMPSTYICCGTLDLFINENIIFTQRLINENNNKKGGNVVELHIYPDAYHAFDTYSPKSNITIQYKNEITNILRNVLF